MSSPTVHSFKLASTDGLRIDCTRWNNDRPPRGIIQIAHGMGEHIGRYLGLIEILVQAGMVVYGNDHRGHGHTATSKRRLGDFGRGGFNLLVADMIHLSRIAKKENPKIPFILLGHGMGSFAAQKYILAHSELIDGLVLSGSGALDELALLANSVSSRDNFLNSRFVSARTPFDWLSRDTAMVDAFASDPQCFGMLQPGSMTSFLAAASKLADPYCLRGIRPDLPIYLFSGSEDPVGQELKGVHVLMDRYRKAGIIHLSHHFYPGGRHEMLNETNHIEVRTNLLLWISEVLHW